MQAYLNVKSRKEARLIRRGLTHKDVRALVLVIGALDALEDPDMQEAALNAAVDVLHAKERSARKRKLPGELDL
jgi:hypothetical protein